MSEQDKKIAEFLGMCWHENPKSAPYNDDGWGDLRATCGKCDRRIKWNAHDEAFENPSFSTWPGFGLLVEGLHERQIDIETYWEPDDSPFVKLYSPKKQPSGEPWTYAAYADTLPEALVAAVEKLIAEDL